MLLLHLVQEPWWPAYPSGSSLPVWRDWYLLVQPDTTSPRDKPIISLLKTYFHYQLLEKKVHSKHFCSIKVPILFSLMCHIACLPCLSFLSLPQQTLAPDVSWISAFILFAFLHKLSTSQGKMSHATTLPWQQLHLLLIRSMSRGVTFLTHSRLLTGRSRVDVFWK